MDIKSTQNIVWMAFFTALLAISAFISLPIGPIPFTLQLLTIYLISLILGPNKAFLVVLLYLFLGAIGLPIFSGGKSGLAAFISPTGGFLLGFLASAFIAGFARNKNIFISALILLFSLVFLYFLGSVWLMYSLEMTLEKTLAVAVAPFVLFDILKIVLAFIVYNILKKRKKLPFQD